MSEKLKIGLLLDGYHVQAWHFSIIEELVLSDFAEISVTIFDDNKHSQEAANRKKGPLIYRLQNRIDRLIFSKNDNYNKVKNISILLKDIPEMHVQTISVGHAEELNDPVIDEIGRFNLDIILKFKPGILTGKILKTPKYGVWSYLMDHYSIQNKRISGYSEVVCGNPVTKSELVILRDAGEENITISDAYESTCSYSVHVNRNKLFWRASLFIPRIVEGIFNNGPGFLNSLVKRYSEDPETSDSKVINNLSVESSRSSFIAFKLLARKLLKKVLFTDPFTWMLLYNINGKYEFLDCSYDNFVRLRPSKDKFWADPFVITKHDRHYIFVEEFIYRKNKGHISVLEIDKTGELVNSQVIIERPYHMSYPHIINSGGIYYMIPETAENRTIDLYKCVEFPYKWVHVKSIMKEINAMDTTLFFYSNKWWLFTLIEKIGFASDTSPELYIYHNNDILSDNWVSHPLNPVVSDVRNARPAGNIFIRNGNIYRPSQDCSIRYGRALNFNQIINLSESQYEEKLISKMYPDWDERLKGMHTFNSDKDFSIIDAYQFRKRLV